MCIGTVLTPYFNVKSFESIACMDGESQLFDVKIRLIRILDVGTVLSFFCWWVCGRACKGAVCFERAL
jgi:hypothetical protein